MDVLCGLFDKVSFFTEVISRSEEKDSELASLSSTVSSISASVRSFVEGMSPDERDRVFQSNQIFCVIMQHIRQCQQIMHKRMPDPNVLSVADSNGQTAVGQERGALATIKSGIDGLKRKSISTLEKTQSLLQEGKQALSGRVGGSVAQLLKLPDDELELIRQSSRELTRLVPLLMLAINAAQARHGTDEERRAEKRRRCSVEPTSAIDVKQLEAEPPKLRMQLVSDHKDSSKVQLPEISASELRPDPVLQRPTSFDTPASARRIFGRKEVTDKVSKDLTLTQAGNPRPQPLNKFVSRDSLLVEIFEPPPDPAEFTQDQATMVFGAAQDDDDLGATLALGGADDDLALGAPEAPASLAVVRGISTRGLHVRNLGDTRWTWFPKDDPAMLKAGDRIGVLLESPPGSSTPGPPRHLEADEVTCLLGIELLDPSAMPSDVCADQTEGQSRDDDERTRELRVTRTKTLSPLRDSH